MRRSKHSLSHYRLLTAEMGKLYPIGCYEVLPGDSVQQSTSLLLRVSPLLAPVMHPVQVRVHHWFVPNRIIWDEWEDFITGSPSISPPAFTTTGTKGDLTDHFGLPISTTAPITVSELPYRAYLSIWNENYRDQDLQAEIPIDPIGTSAVQHVAWEKDYFTTARPWPQKGPDVTLPLGVRADVKGLAVGSQGFTAGGTPRYDVDGSVSYPFERGVDWQSGASGSLYVKGTAATGLPDIYADLTNATAVNINDVRKAFALQRYQEARAQYGSRYTEYLAYLGVRSSDARLQRPEYLGGGKATVSFSEVLRTGNETAGAPPAVIGELKGHGISALRSRRYRRFFEEHGFVMSLLSVRPRAMYMHGIERMWSRQTKEDYWQRELELIGQQEVYTRELWGDLGGSGVFGYGDRYSEYRHLWSKISGDFRDTLNFWHMAREFSAAPTLNASFVECEPTKRINAVTTGDNLWIMASHSIQARRLVGKKTIGRVM